MNVGERFGRLVTTGRVQGAGREKWACLCDCGANVTVLANNLKTGNTSSCGCYAKDMQQLANTTHGMSRTRPNNIYKAMKSRCLNINDTAFDDYGGRGITVCDEWLHSFDVFWEDMRGGYSDELTLERIDTNGNYSKENCVWATRNQQAQNTRKRSTNKSGVTGVCFRPKRGVEGSWVAQWRSMDGSVEGKSFSVRTYGYEEAKRLAIETRVAALAELNSKGAQYTERHGE